MINFIPISRQKEIVVQELQGELLIYDLNINKAFCLNETSAAVWQLCDGKNSVADISRFLNRKLKSPVLEDFVLLAIDQLKENNLLADGDEIEIDFNGLSRREVIKKIGFASMIVLPVISSLTAPTTAAAQSNCVANGQPNGFACSLANNPGLDFCNILPCSTTTCNCTVSGSNARCCSGQATTGSCVGGRCVCICTASTGNTSLRSTRGAIPSEVW